MVGAAPIRARYDQAVPDAPAPPPPAALIPAPGDTWHAEREKAELAAKLARAFLEDGNGPLLGGMLAVMAQIATTSTVSARTRSRTAAAYVKLAIEASQRGFRGVAVQVNTGGTSAAPASPVRDRAFWQAALADPDLRAQVLGQLSAELGIPAPVKATRPGKDEAIQPVEVEIVKPGRRTSRRNGKASTNGHAAGNGTA